MPAPQTLFVASLPATASNQRLEEIFSEIGPVKQCFVVKEKGTEKCRGFGYVTYSMDEDATQAMKTIKEYDGQRISVSVAKKKIKDNKKTAKEAAKKPTEEAPKEAVAAAPAAAAAAAPPPAPKENEQFSKGIRKKLLKAKLIIRNLSFKCSEDDLKQVFSKFGTVLETNIPLKPDGKMRGFAFVLFKNVSQAAKALQSMNLKEIKGRQVAVDWAIPKDKYLATQLSAAAGNKTTEATPAKQSKSKDDDDDEDDDDDDDDEEEEEKKPAAPAKKKVSSKPAVKVEEPQSEDDDDDDEEEEEDEQKKPAAPAKKKVSSKPAVKVEESQSEDEDDEDEDDGEEDDDDEDEEEEEEDDDHEDSLDSDHSEDEDDDDDDDDDDEEEDEEEKAAAKKAKNKLLPSDVKEGRTIFIRNLSFDTEEEGLEEVLLRYGELNYIKIVVHPDTEHSKGCAFAQYKTKESADKCIAAADESAENGGILLDGRKLLIVAAVTRDDAAKLRVDKKKVETGTRNLYLAREGLIRAGTKAAEGVSEADMAKRTRFEEVKRAKLRDIAVFVSKNRLCIHNLPKSVDNNKLRELCLQTFKAKKKGVRLPECRVMYDKKPEKGQVMGQSLGYGFAQFQEHEHALAALRYLNNNPGVFGAHKRPIVEFSLEDSRKLKLKELRKEKNKQFVKNRPFKAGAKPQAGGSGPGPRQRGGKPHSSSENGRGPPQDPRKDKKFSGFQTKPEVEHVDLGEGKKRKKVLHLPSHRGPKIRMRDKGKQQGPPPKKMKPGAKRREPQRRNMEKPMQSRNQMAKGAKKPFKRDGDRFDSLVEQYKKKLMGNSDKSGTNVKRNKWFNS